MTRRTVHKLAWAAFVIFLLAWIGSHWLASYCTVQTDSRAHPVHVGLVARHGLLGASFATGMQGHTGPLQPSWWGYAAHDSGPYGTCTSVQVAGWLVVALFSIYPLGAFVRRYWRRRPTPGHCAKCGYDLTGNTSGVCPECGGRI